ncbi:hypothetical protein B7463_g5660, partial [Scytalidium lignicola]
MAKVYQVNTIFHYLRCSSLVKNPYDFWHGLVHLYSLRQLSFENDKLPAVSGIASEVHEITDLEYLAGLWKENLVADLCWHRDYEIGGLQVPGIQREIYVAPSWSWASIDGSIGHPDFCSSLDPLVTILKSRCTVPGENSFGKVTDGFITIQGPLVEMTLRCKDPKDYRAYTLSAKKAWVH